MGAIWGTIIFGNNTNTGFSDMQPVYEEKCKIDSYSTTSFEMGQMGAGILHVRNIDKKECLPIKDNNVVITADCLLDNREDLLNVLNAEDITDGEIIKRLYIAYGVESFKMLRGLFAIAIYLETENKLILVSDPVSSRCLYYYQKNDVTYFSTLIEPIEKAVRGIEKNWQYIEDFMMAPGLMPNLFSSDTPYLGVKKCNPGSWIEITKKRVVENSYFDLKQKDESNPADFMNVFNLCIQDAINTNSHVAMALSSGLDSSSIGVLASKQLINRNEILKAFTYVPIEDIKNAPKDIVLNETNDVLDICKPYLNIDNAFLNNNGKNCIDEINKIVEILEIPFKAFVNFPNLAEIFEKASDCGCKVVLTGQTGNASISHGYIDDVLFDLFEKRKYFTFLKFLNRYCKKIGESRKVALKNCLGYFNYSKKILIEDLGEYANANRFLNDKFIEKYPYKSRFKSAGILSLKKIPMNENMHKKFLYNKALYTYMGEYETKLGLKYGLIVRDPTKDIKMLKFCFNLPYKYYANNGVPRWLIRDNFKGLIPDRILNDWMRYGVQNCDWINRVLRDWDNGVENQFRSIVTSNKLSEYIDRKKVSILLDNINDFEKQELDIGLSELGYLLVLSRFLEL